MFYQFQHSGLSESFSRECRENFNFPLHLHQSFEFVYIMSGAMEIQIENKVYVLDEGDAVRIFPNQLHSFNSRHSKHFLCIFSPDLVKAYVMKYQNKKPSDNRFQPNDYLVQTVYRLEESASLFEKKGVLYSLCAEFDKQAHYELRVSQEIDLLYKIFNFVELNYKGDCSLEILAEKTGFSYFYLSRYFKKTTGISYHEYVNIYRVSNACYLLSNSNVSVLQCALESGYRSLRSFNRNFKLHTKQTPKEYRENL